MTEIRFYHLTRSTMEQALPDLLEKTLGRGWRAVVRVGSEMRAESLSASLWTYRKESFLPHGSAKDGFAADQPIWITAATDCPNAAEVLFLIDGPSTEGLGDYALVCDIFDGNDSEIADGARGRWTQYKKDGHQLAYWQQGEKGWTNKSE